MKPTDIYKIPYENIADMLIKNNIKIHHAINNPKTTILVNKDIVIENNVTFRGRVESLWSMGMYSYSGSNLGYGVSVGRYCSIAFNVSIMGAHHYPEWISTSPIFYDRNYHSWQDIDTSNNARLDRNVIIGNDVWIGAGVVLKNNIVIGDGAIIASNSVVTKDVPPFMIVGGNPAQIIRPRFDTKTIAKIYELEWWNYDKDLFRGLDASKPMDFLCLLSNKIHELNVGKYNGVTLTENDFLACMKGEK